jgi:hypothetical protein
MKTEHEAILIECYRRMQEHKETPRPPEWQWWNREPYDEVTTHGPEYGCGEWFGDVPEHQRMRYRRAIADLERGGLLITWCRWGRRLSHIKLTATGCEVVEGLAESALEVADMVATG